MKSSAVLHKNPAEREQLRKQLLNDWSVCERSTVILTSDDVAYWLDRLHDCLEMPIGTSQS